MRVWLLSGTMENWERALSGSVWGVREGLKTFWDKLTIGDILLFYVVSPVSGVVGIGKVESKFEQRKPFWSDEVKENKVIYPFRFEFKTNYIIPQPQWKENKIKIQDLNVSFRSGINSILNKEATKALMVRLDQSWNTNFLSFIEGVPEKIVEKKKPTNLHDEIKQKLKEIGDIEGFLSQTEYTIPGYTFDVVWRSANVVGGVPKYVFEVQIGGDIKHALTNLKHAFDAWGFPKLFLIAEENDIGKAAQLMSGAFHEIKERLKLVPVEKIVKLHELQVEDNKLKKEIGIP